MTRPGVDVIVPFKGSQEELQIVLKRMRRLELRASDTLRIVDNSLEPASGSDRARTMPEVFRADEVHTPGYARNRGAAVGSAEWLVFLDTDTEPIPDLLNRYFDPPPEERTALIAGGVIDEEVPPDARAAARYAWVRGALSQSESFALGARGYPKSANVACRRFAFEAVGGFREELRAAEDADLAYRLQAAGWTVERREEAAVVHLARQSVWGLLKQKAVWGAGGAEINRRYPGSAPARRWPGLAWWSLRTATRGLLAAWRAGDRDIALRALLEPLETLAFELGRSLPNDRPLTAASWRRATRRFLSRDDAPRR